MLLKKFDSGGQQTAQLKRPETARKALAKKIARRNAGISRSEIDYSNKGLVIDAFALN